MSDIAIGLWALLEFAISGPNSIDFAKRMYWETSLFNDILSYKGPKKYDRLLIPGTLPLEVTPILNVEHLETLDEREQIMVMHGSLTVLWHDDRLAWNRSLYGGISSISKSRGYLKLAQMEPYVPRMYITEIFSRTADLLAADSTILNILYTGAVTANVRLQIKTTCHFKFDDFPRDQQNCSYSFFIPTPISSISIEAVGFEYRPVMNMRKNPPLSVEKFEFKTVERKTLYLLPGSVKVEDPKSYPPSLIRSIAFYNFVFQRRFKYYSLQMGYPVFCISCCTYLFAMFRSIHAVAWLLFALCFQVVAFSSVAAELPPDYGKMPRIAFVATLVLLQTILLIVWKLAQAFIEQRHKNDPKVLTRIGYIEIFLRVCVPLLVLFNYVNIFM